MSILVDWYESAFKELLQSREIAAGVERVAEQAAVEMARRAPRDEDNEHLADHIATASGQDMQGVYTDVGIDAARFFYWRFVNYGTKRAAAEPFVGPALNRQYTV